MASEIVAPSKLEVTTRASAITKDGVTVKVVAEGPGVPFLERRYAERNMRLWNQGKRPNRLGIWR